MYAGSSSRRGHRPRHDRGWRSSAPTLTALAAWGPTGQVLATIAGPPWLRALLPLLIGAPLLLRRRAGGDATLAKIETSGRQALVDTRRLFGVLHDPRENRVLAPQPGIDELDDLAVSVRSACLPVTVVISGNRAVVPVAVDVSVYRIVQEALTNVLKHAGHARAEVTIGCADDAVTIEISDDGTTPPPNRTSIGGLGLTGMRERVAIYGGERCAGLRPESGFAVQARLPLRDGLPRGDATARGEGLS